MLGQAEFHCRFCNTTFLSRERGEISTCTCGEQAQRVWGSFGLHLKTTDPHWNPVVGEVIHNDGQFRSLLAQGQERESERLGMDVKLATVDSRDNEGLAELHGQSVAERSEIIAKSEFQRKQEANA